MSGTGSAGFDDVFRAATGFDRPYPFQRRLATAEELPSLVEVPTGLGKTEAAVLSWLWRRRFADESMRACTPRRLVYCLPMRVLVEQTLDRVKKMLDRLGLLAAWPGDDMPPSCPLPCPGASGRIAVSVLMGGEDEDGWDAWPERDAILVGTQDILLSRALNRGYAMSRFRWPVAFGLLNNDCLWVMDEVQLMGNGLATTAQLQAFRRLLGVVGGARSMWMSATMNPAWLGTVDFAPEADAPGGTLALAEDDRADRRLAASLCASKPLRRADFNATDDAEAEAGLALDLHAPGTRTLVVVNTVRRAQGVYAELKKREPHAELVLIHSRFRPADRAAHLERLLAEPGPAGTIGVCTQVVEAGVDLSARVLITDLAPWPSMVQRFGRCNRKGEFDATGDARVVWIAPPGLEGDKVESAPYTAEELRLAASRLAVLTDAGPAHLPPTRDPMEFGHVLRRKDLLDLFDTTPDLAGADLDVSRYVREADEHDVHVFWRDVPKGVDPPADAPGPSREELCPVPVGEARAGGRSAWRWDHLDRRWVRAETLFPGMTLMLRADEGGYEPERGWTGAKGRVEPVSRRREREDRQHPASQWQSLRDHTDRVVEALSGLLGSLGGLAPWADALLTAARWHDVGKAHAVFQDVLPAIRPVGETVFAKAPAYGRYARPGFRHELASAVAVLGQGLPDIVAYLVAAHHGKVRLSIRSLPHERPPRDDPDARFARGVFEGDELPAADLGGGVSAGRTRLTLSYMELGEDPVTGPSWLARMLALRDRADVGPFRLALLEAVLRIADWRASSESVRDRDDEDET